MDAFAKAAFDLDPSNILKQEFEDIRIIAQREVFTNTFSTYTLELSEEN